MRKTTFALCGILVLSTIGAARVAMTQDDLKPFEGDLNPEQKPIVENDERRRFKADAPPSNNKPPSNPSWYRARQIARTVTHYETIMEQVSAEELAKAKKLQDAIQSLKTSTDEVARKKATEFIQQQLASQFEDDLKQREKELAEVEQRVTKLREQLDKRKVAQKAIIDLRLQTIVNDADGLGFPDMNFGGENRIVPPSNAPLYVPGGATRSYPDEEFPSETAPTINRTDQ